MLAARAPLRRDVLAHALAAPDGCFAVIVELPHLSAPRP